MSRDTILDEAIAKAKEAEDWQLAEWLRMARGAESASRWYSDKLREAHRVERKLLNENAKLRELANGYEVLTATLCNERGCDGCPFDGTEQIVCEHMRMQTCLSELRIKVD